LISGGLSGPAEPALAVATAGACPFAAAFAAGPSKPGRDPRTWLVEVFPDSICKRCVCGVCSSPTASSGVDFDRLRLDKRVCGNCAGPSGHCEKISLGGVCEIDAEGLQRMKSFVGGLLHLAPDGDRPASPLRGGHAAPRCSAACPAFAPAVSLPPLCLCFEGALSLAGAPLRRFGGGSHCLRNWGFLSGSDCWK